MGDVVRPTFHTTADVPVADVVAGIPETLTDVFVIGVQPDGSPFHASSTACAATLLLMLERARFDVVRRDPFLK